MNKIIINKKLYMNNKIKNIIIKDNNIIKKDNNIIKKDNNIIKNDNNIIKNDILDLSNKSVCIVSYATYMQNKKLGKYIDSFDYVTRINIGIYPIDVDDFGKKTNIASLSISSNKIPKVIKIFNNFNNNKYNNIDDICKENNIKYVLGLGVKNDEINKWKIYFDSFKDSNIKYLIDYNYDKYTIKDLFGLTNGLKTIIYILKCKPIKTYICGFDFSMNIYDKYIPYHQNVNNNNNNISSYEEWSKIKRNNSLWHSTILEKYILKKLYIKFKFEIDDELKKILNKLNENNNDENIFNCVFYNIEVKIKYIDLFNKIYVYINS
jgi:hypothetical protein